MGAALSTPFAGLPAWIPALWLFAVGLAVGSFLNVVIARVPEGLSIVKPRSRCPKCGHMLPWYENIPLFSWIALRGKCSSCKTPISFRYPAVELLTGLLFLACLRKFDWTFPLVSAVVLVSLLIALTFIDLEHWLLPFALTIPGTIAGILLSIPQGLGALRDSAIGAAVGFFVFWAMEFVGEKIFKKEALGGGDKFLLALLGAFLTWKALLGIIFLSSLQGAVIGILMIAIKGRAHPAPESEAEKPEPEPPAENADEKAAEGDEEEDDWTPGPTNIPFGPWLSLAGLELLLFGPELARLAPGLVGEMLGFQ